jgi:hypothetical protein
MGLLQSSLSILLTPFWTVLPTPIGFNQQHDVPGSPISGQLVMDQLSENLGIILKYVAATLSGPFFLNE